MSIGFGHYDLPMEELPYMQELVAKSLESSDLDFSRYGDTFFEASILIFFLGVRWSDVLS